MFSSEIARAGGSYLVLLPCTGIFRHFSNKSGRGKPPETDMPGIRVIKESAGHQRLEATGRNLMRAVDGLPGIYVWAWSA